MNETRTITQVTKTYGISTRTLRYYEQVGLITSTRMDGYAYRVYDDEACARLAQILILRKLRIPLKQIASLLSDNSVIGALGMFMQHIDEIDEEIATLSTIRNILQTFADRLRENPNLRLNANMLSDERLLSIFAPLSTIKTNYKEEILMADTHQNEKPVNSIEQKKTPNDIQISEDVNKLLDVDPILILFGYGIIPLVDNAQDGNLLERIVTIRRQLIIEKGVVIPIIRLKDDKQLSHMQYTISIKNKLIASGEIMMGHYMAIPNDNTDKINPEDINGIETLEPCRGNTSFWIPESHCEHAKKLGCEVIEPTAVIAAHLTEIIRSNLHLLLTLQDVQKYIERVKEENPILIDELVPKYLSLNNIKQILSSLLEKGFSIRDMLTILETLLDYAPTTRDSNELAIYVQQKLC